MSEHIKPVSIKAWECRYCGIKSIDADALEKHAIKNHVEVKDGGQTQKGT